MHELWTIPVVLPTVLVLIGGIGYIFAARRRSRRAAVLTLLALIGMMLTLGYEIAYQTWIVHVVLNNRGIGGIDPLTFLRLHGALMSSVQAFFLGLLIIAVMIDRPPASSPQDG